MGVVGLALLGLFGFLALLAPLLVAREGIGVANPPGVEPEPLPAGPAEA